MAEIGAIRVALAAALEGSGLQASPYLLSNPTPPCAQVLIAGTEYDLANARGLDRISFRIQGFVALATDIGSQRKLDEYLASSGARSLKALLEADRTLGGLVADLRVVGHDGQTVYVPEGKGPMLGAEWLVEVLASGQ